MSPASCSASGMQLMARARRRPWPGFAAALILVAAEVAAAAAHGGLRFTPGAPVKVPEGPTPLYPDRSEDLGSITPKEAKATETFIKKPIEKMKVEDVYNAEADSMSCDDLETYVKDLLKKYEQARTKAFWLKFEVSKMSSKGEDRKKIDKKAEEVEKAVYLDQKMHQESVRVVEMLGLKCGATDGYCAKQGKDLIQKFAKLAEAKSTSEALMVEAGWLQAETQVFGASKESKIDARNRKVEAWRQIGEVFDLEQQVANGITVKAAACGLRPPRGPWGDSKNACNLKPKDPVMQAILKEDPQEFIRRWREEIAKQIGISPKYVRIDVSKCFPLAVTPTEPPPDPR